MACLAGRSSLIMRVGVLAFVIITAKYFRSLAIMPVMQILSILRIRFCTKLRMRWLGPVMGMMRFGGRKRGTLAVQRPDAIRLIFLKHVGLCAAQRGVLRLNGIAAALVWSVQNANRLLSFYRSRIKILALRLLQKREGRYVWIAAIFI
jgi:hypothetical protein